MHLLYTIIHYYYTHLYVGLVADRNLTLGNLIALIRTFFEKIGITEIRFKPAYNPYTEPSMEVCYIYYCVYAITFILDVLAILFTSIHYALYSKCVYMLSILYITLIVKLCKKYLCIMLCIVIKHNMLF